jgi:hypothetical protein
MKIDLNNINDDLSGNWWLHIHSSNFGFLSKISDLKNHEVEMEDILIHKEMKEGERFPSVRYHLVKEKEITLIENEEVKEILSNQLITYITKNKKMPYACKVTKFFKNGNVQINYHPTDFDNLALKVIPKIHGIENVEEFFKDLKTSENPIKTTLKPAYKAQGRQWEIPSSKDPDKKYIVKYSEDGTWSCTCPQFTFRKVHCKHIEECKKKSMKDV